MIRTRTGQRSQAKSDLNGGMNGIDARRSSVERIRDTHNTSIYRRRASFGSDYDDSSSAISVDSSSESSSAASSLESGKERHPDGVPAVLEFSSEDAALLASKHLTPAKRTSAGAHESFAERGNAMQSITWLAAHLPICVLDHLNEEIKHHDEFRKVTGYFKDSTFGAFGGEDGISIISDLSEGDNQFREQARTDADFGGSTGSKDSAYSGDESSTDVDSCRHYNSLNGDDLQEAEPPAPRYGRRSQQQTYEQSQIVTTRNGQIAGKVTRITPMPVQNELRESYSDSFTSLESGGMKSSQSSQSRSKPKRRLIKMNGRLTPELKRRLSNGTQASDNSCSSASDHVQRLMLSSRHLTIDEEEEESASHNERYKPPPASLLTKEYELARRALGIGVVKAASTPANTVGGSTKATSATQATFSDPFPYDSDDDVKLNKGAEQPRLNRRASTRIRQRKAGHNSSFVLPHSTSYQAALLFVDISGFTKLATALDPEQLSKAINSYFQLIINEVTFHGGDVLKFAGDALFVEWKATSGDSTTVLGTRKKTSLTQCVYVAAVCASKIVAKCSDFPIFAHQEIGRGQGSQVATLNVHCGLGVGQIVGVNVGDYTSRREYLILGDPIDQVSKAVDAATLGEVAVSPQALVTLRKSCSVDECLDDAVAGKPVVIARRALSHFQSTRKIETADFDHSSAKALSTAIEAWHVNSLKQYQKLMSLYAHPVVVNNISSNQNRPQSKTSVQERHRAEAELRSVFVLFVTPLISVRVTGNKEMDRHLYKLLNNIMNIVTRELKRFSGHLRQFIVDDKGLVLIATFGLRGSTFPNMVAERALPATITLHNALQNELGVQNQVGATIGTAYCGVVGGIKRHEYAVLGPSVNLAARLMSSPKNPGILVDDAVRRMADRSYAFNALPPVKAKGYPNPVPIFEPLSPLERSWGRVQPNFVGRKEEIMLMKSTARYLALNQSPSKMMFITGKAGMGKSTLVVHAIEHIRRLMSASRRRVIVTKHVSKESDALIPFGIFRSILISVLTYFKGSQDDRSYVSRGSSHGMDNSIGWESLGECSFAPSEATGLTRSADRFSSICRELNAPPAFQDLVGHHLLGNKAKAKDSTKGRTKGSNMKSLVSFMAKAFKRCTQEANLVIIALDDVHHMDEMSWKVVQELFQSAPDILFICSSRPLEKYPLLVDKKFWKELNDTEKADDRFVMMTMEPLPDFQIKSMIAKTLGLQEREVSTTLLNDVLMQSNGRLDFANEVLEAMKRLDIDVNGSDDEKEAHAPVGELFLHRIDSFDAAVRNVLNLGAVLGSSFELKEVVAVLSEIVGKESSDRKALSRKSREALDVAVTEGILYLVPEQPEMNDGNNDEGNMFSEMGFHESNNLIGNSSGGSNRSDNLTNAVYTFCHDVWRTTILNKMLDESKRDMHKIIAKTLEELQEGQNADDYLSRMKLFSHWKAAGDSCKATSLALSIGTSFEELGLQDQSIKVFQDALDMWQVGTDTEYLSTEALESLTVTDLEWVIKVHIALAQCLANIHKAAESVVAYQNALRILQASPSAENMTDRSISFPIFSGLFVALKFGQIEQDEESTFEQSLVARFVYETRLHGDPVHYTRALSMQGEMFGRLGMYEKAFASHNLLAAVYDASEHSAGICASYGSDRAAQSFCISVVWQVEKGNIADALDTCWYVINELFPHMDPRNVHNSCMMLYPILWVLKENGFAMEARDHFIRLVVEPFNEYYGDGRSTFCLPVYDPIMMVLDLVGNPGDPENFNDYLEWALDEENLRFGTVINCSLGSLGRCADSISAEICLVLAERLPPSEEKKQLILLGLDITSEVISLAECKNMIVAGKECGLIHGLLHEVADELEMSLIRDNAD